MVKRIVTMVLLLVCLVFASAQSSQAFKAGAWEIGGNLSYSDRSDYPPLDSSVVPANKDDHTIMVDASFVAGIFLKEGFSLSLRPSFVYYDNISLAADLSKSTRPMMEIGLALEPCFYIPLGERLALSLGTEIGAGVWPGINRLSSGVTVTNKGLAVNFELEPKVGAFYFLGRDLAITAQFGYKFIYMRTILNSSGNTYSYPTDYSILTDLYGRTDLTLGLKYFIPQGGRAGQARAMSFDEFLDAMGGGGL